jgi:hypothetical protein
MWIESGESWRSPLTSLLHDGQVSDIGTHDELLSRSPYYARLDFGGKRKEVPGVKLAKVEGKVGKLMVDEKRTTGAMRQGMFTLAPLTSLSRIPRCGSRGVDPSTHNPFCHCGTRCPNHVDCVAHLLGGQRL